jgi:DNA repair protein RadD
MLLRDYQSAAIDAAYQYLRNNSGNPVIVIPTGGGKTPVLASICQDTVAAGGRVLVISHVKELLQQQQAALQATCPDIPVGLYSAGLNSRDDSQPVIVAGIQSIYRRACELGVFHVVIVDEAHLIPMAGDGMYRQLLADLAVINPSVRVIGLTATPYRLKDGLICDADHFLNDICYEIGVAELIEQGWLCPLKSKSGVEKPDLSAVHVRGGEYMLDELEDAFNDDDLLVGRACAEIVNLTESRHSVLIFCSGVMHGQNVAHGVTNFAAKECGFLCGETPAEERAETLARFKAGELKYLANVNVLTTGFDAPNVDSVVLLRATLSPGLYYQMVGRGFRTDDSKSDCLVLDYGDNIMRHGPVDRIKVVDRRPTTGGDAPVRECPDCHEMVSAGFNECPECGYVFPPPDKDPHAGTASDQRILSSAEPVFSDEEFEVTDIDYNVHTKRGAADDAPRTMRVTYTLYLGGTASEWVCIEHTGWARKRAVSWWEQRTDIACPATADEAVELANEGHLSAPHRLTLRTTEGKQWPEIAGINLAAPLAMDVNNEFEVPF